MEWKLNQRQHQNCLWFARQNLSKLFQWQTKCRHCLLWTSIRTNGYLIHFKVFETLFHLQLKANNFATIERYHGITQISSRLRGLMLPFKNRTYFYLWRSKVLHTFTPYLWRIPLHWSIRKFIEFRRITHPCSWIRSTSSYELLRKTRSVASNGPNIWHRGCNSWRYNINQGYVPM